MFRTRLHGSFETMSPSQPVDGAPGPTVQASQAAYQAAASAGTGGDMPGDTGAGGGGPDDDVIDAEYEVKDE